MTPTSAVTGLAAVWIGGAANATTPTGETTADIQLFSEVDAALGPLTYRRSFDTSLPSSFATSAAGGDAAGGYRSFVSWKPRNDDFRGAAEGKYDKAITAWARSAPRSGVYATVFHEPENNMTAAQFVAMMRHVYPLVKAANSGIQFGSVYSAYFWNSKEPGHYVGDPDAWWPGNDYADFSAVDTYSAIPTPLEQDPQFRGWYDNMIGRGKPMLISEYGQYAVRPGSEVDPAMLAARVQAIQADAAWISKENVITMWIYWDGTGAAGDWTLRDPASQQAWRDIARQGRTG